MVTVEMKKTTVCAATAALALIGLLTPAAKATNIGSKDGENPNVSACTIDWTAQSVMDTDLTNDDPNYPNLMTALDGSPIESYFNGGYITEVSPNLGSVSAWAEVQHFYNGVNPRTLEATVNTVQVWRPSIAALWDLSNITVTFMLPEEVKDLPGQVFDPVSVNSRIGLLWGEPYSNYTWASRFAPDAYTYADGVYTLHLDSLKAGEATVFQFSIPTGTTLDTKDQFVGTLKVTGTRTTDANGLPCQPTQPDPQDVSSTPVVDTSSVCTNGEVSETVTRTLTPYVYDYVSGTWSLDEAQAVTTTETTTRPATEGEKASCTPTPEPTQPTDKPTDKPTTPADPKKPSTSTKKVANTGASAAGAIALMTGTMGADPALVARSCKH